MQALEDRNPGRGADGVRARGHGPGELREQEAAAGGESPTAASSRSLPVGDAYHRPVMVEEVVEALAPAARGWVVDGTAGGGGHTEALLQRYPELRVVAVDRDPEAMATLALRLHAYPDRVRRLHARFDDAALLLAEEGMAVDGVLLDLGISSRQIDHDARGFTFRDDAPLDGRMDRAHGDGESRTGGEGGDPSGDDVSPGVEGRTPRAGSTLTAATLLNTWDEAGLAHLFRRLAEEPRARRLAAAIVEHREGVGPLRVAGDLNRLVDQVYRRPTLARERAPLYQALRIHVNAELEALEAALPRFRDLLRPGGVFAVLSYHSLEDRQVKNAFREWSRRCICPPELLLCQCRGEALGTLVNRSVVRPSEAEVEENPRARSARFRVWRKAA